MRKGTVGKQNQRVGKPFKTQRCKGQKIRKPARGLDAQRTQKQKHAERHAEQPENAGKEKIDKPHEGHGVHIRRVDEAAGGADGGDHDHGRARNSRLDGGVAQNDASHDRNGVAHGAGHAHADLADDLERFVRGRKIITRVIDVLV